MQVDPLGQIKKLADFLGIETDDASIERVARLSSFESMRGQAGESEAASHLRKGVSGDWKTHFDQELFEDFKDIYHSQLAGTGIQFSLGAGHAPWTATLS